MLDEPGDFIGNILAKLINRRYTTLTDTQNFKNWDMSIIIETDYYPVSILFENTVKIKSDAIQNPTLIFKMKFNTIVSIVKEETTILRALLKGAIQVKGLVRHPRAAFRFYRLMNSILK
ncbi:hypothetical protein EU527_12505 [Candidatus Thorarchaeota archaeon]|nr:MAG: hypothetical protein EU527_12505 [Candidatus Thorarchaeota archaeon]